MPSNGHRLGERRDVRRQAVGHRHHHRLLDDHLLGVGARSVRRQTDRVDAVRRRARAAQRRPASPSAACRHSLGPYSATLPENSCPKTIGLVGAPEAVIAGALGHLRPLVDAVAGVQVRAADAAAQHLDPHLAASRRRLGQIDDLQLRVLAGDGPHRAAPVVWSSRLVRSVMALASLASRRARCAPCSPAMRTSRAPNRARTPGSRRRPSRAHSPCGPGSRAPARARARSPAGCGSGG